MRKLGIAALGLLCGWYVNLPMGADAAPAFPYAIAAGSGHGDVLLVQYGGGDDDDRPPRNNGGYNNGGNNNQGYQQPQQHRNNNNNFNNGAAAAGAIFGIINGIAQQQQRQKAIREQQQYNNQLRKEQFQRNQRAHDREIKQRKEKNKEDARERELKHEQAIKDEQLKKLKEEVQEQKKQLEVKEATQREDEKYPDSDEQDQTDDRIHNTHIKINPSRNGMPVPENLPNLVVGPTKLPACGYVNLPPDRNLCGGSTDGGNWLRIVTVPMLGGGSSQACVQFSRECKPRLAIIPKPTPPTPPQLQHYNPVPPPPVSPVVCSYPPCAPTPVPPPACTGPNCGEQGDRARCSNPPCVTVVTPPPCSGASCREQRDQACANPPCITPSVVTPKPEERKPTYPTYKTDTAKTVVQKEEEKQVTPPVPTDKAEKVVQKQEEKKVTPPVKTDTAEKVVQKEEEKKVTPPVKTDTAEKVVQKEEEKKVTPPVKTDTAEKVVQKEEEKKVTPPVKTDTADNGGEIDEAVSFNRPTDNPFAQDCMSLISPMRYPNLNLSNWRSDPDYQKCMANNKKAEEEKTKHNEEITKKKKEDDEWKKFVENPGQPDSKGCTVRGDKPLKDLLKSPTYQALLGPNNPIAPITPEKTPWDYIHAREVVTGAMSAIPEVGALIGGLTKVLWKDKSQDQLLDELKNYIDALVPDSINKERIAQMESTLTGLRNALKTYESHHNTHRKGGDLATLIQLIDTAEPQILDGSDRSQPEQVAALVVAFGVLQLTALTEQVAHENDYYEKDKQDPGTDSDKLNAKILRYSELAKDIKKKIIDRRLAKIVPTARDDSRFYYCGESCDGNSWLKYWRAADQMCDWHAPDEHGGYVDNGESDNGLKQAQADAQRHKDEVRKTYERDLDILLSPITNWPSLTPIARSTDEKGRPLPPRPVAQLDDASVDDATPPVKTDKAAPAESKRSELISPPTKTEKAKDVIVKKPKGQPQKTADASGQGGEIDEAAAPSVYMNSSGYATLGDADGTELGGFLGEAVKALPMALGHACTRHLRNDSDDTWEVRGVEGSGVCEKPGSCVAKPHHMIEINYPLLEHPIKVTITAGGESAFNETFEVKLGNLITTGNCAYIEHDGRTGKVRLNQPADGDISALNMDAAHRLKRRTESINRIVNTWRRRQCQQNPSKCRYAHDD